MFLAVPSDYEDLLNYYTHKGYRVIACAAKYERKLSWMKVQKMTREEAESNLEFLGFIIFENKLKPSTAGVITELNEAGIRNVMCTGDNILTAISVARECKLLGRNEMCFIPHFVEGLFLLFTSLLVSNNRQHLVFPLKFLSYGNAWTILTSSWTREHFW
jgi:cation-transporting ATPase 13A3/4/5